MGTVSDSKGFQGVYIGECRSCRAARASYSVAGLRGHKILRYAADTANKQMAGDLQDNKDLHANLAQHLKDKLDEGTINTSELNVLRQFLKDNQVSAQPAEGTPFGDLAKALPDIENVVSFKRKAG